MAFDLRYLEVIGLPLVRSHGCQVCQGLEVQTSLVADSLKSSDSQGVEAVMQQMLLKAADLGLESARFQVVSPDYYDQSLEWRREKLGAASEEELCKSVVLENTKLSSNEVTEKGRIHCVLVIVQYVAKLNKEKLTKALQNMEASLGLPPLGKKQYNMRLLEGESCAQLTGFEHNAVTPLGLDLPVVLSDRIAALPSQAFWLGGGHVDLKLRLGVAEAQSRLKAVIADVTG